MLKALIADMSHSFHKTGGHRHDESMENQRN